MVNETDLDPATLRAIAEMTDHRAAFYSGQCPCMMHRALMNYSLQLAADLRTRAIRIDQARETARKAALLAAQTRELPTVIHSEPGYVVERVPRSEVLRGTRGGPLRRPAPLPIIAAGLDSAAKAGAEHERYEQAIRAIGGSLDRYRELLRTTAATPAQAYRQVARETHLSNGGA